MNQAQPAILHAPTAVADRVARRQVFYIPGYDPIPPRRYRELYRTEAAMQAGLSGYQISLRAATAQGSAYGWNVEAIIEGQAVATSVKVLVWSDIVRNSMGGGIAATYVQLARTAWAYVGSGALFRLMRLRKGPVIAALYPIVMLTLQLIAAMGFGWLAWHLAAGVMSRVAPANPAGLTFVVSGATAAMATWGVLRWFRAMDGRFYAYYLMHDYAFSARDGGANPRELDHRLDEFRDTIRAALSEGVDEVLVVGHSSGAHLAVTILADLLRSGLPHKGTVLSFLSLGQVIPMISFLPGASRLRADLAFLSVQTGLTWVDVTAPGDGCAFALCDPVAVSGVAPPGQRWPLILSAAFTQTLTAPRWKALRWRFFRLHFQYLCAFDNLAGRTDDYDYFRITAGPMTLGARYAGRRPSQSRIVTPVNRFTDTDR